MIRTAKANYKLAESQHPVCPACHSFMKAFGDQDEQDCTSCGIVWER